MNVLHLFAKLHFATLVIILFATGCQPSETGTSSLAEGVPANAILVGDQLYMVPTGKIDAGCQMYRAFSPTDSVVAAIFYRGTDGKFVMDRSKSECS